MSNKNKNKNQEKKNKELEEKKQVSAEEVLESSEDIEVVMTFSEDKFYTDDTKPIFEKDEKYKLKGKEWINRWLKRGGKIIGPGSELNPESAKEETLNEKPEDSKIDEGKFVDPNEDPTEDIVE